MDNKEFARRLEKRTKDFAVSVLKLTAVLPSTPEGKVVRYQLAKSATSVGANYREANRARSKADFKSKISISESEASETAFWLEIIEEMKWLSSDKYAALLIEINELIAIFSSIGKNLIK